MTLAHSCLEGPGPLTHGPLSFEEEGGGNRLVIPGGGTFESFNLLTPALEVRTLTSWSAQGPPKYPFLGM